VTIARSVAYGRVAAAAFAIGVLTAVPAFAQDDPNDPATCASLWEAIGLPALDEESDVETVPVCHAGYVLAHNSQTKTPDWVIERLSRDVAEGTATRPEVRFRQEPSLPETAPGAKDADYSGSGFDRGHQAPSADFKSSTELMADTFFLSNAVPQQGKGFNQDIWRILEALVRDVAIERGELYIITGPIYQEESTIKIGSGDNVCGVSLTIEPLRNKTIGGSKVAVPAALYKIAYDPFLGRLNAFLLANVDHRGHQDGESDIDYLEAHRVGLDTIEDLTGWRFFTAFDERTGNVLRRGCAATMLH
jgi:endonuclease G